MSTGDQSGIFRPASFSFIEEKVFSIQINPSIEDQEELDRYVLEDGLSLTYQARYALTLYRESFMTPADHAKDNVGWYLRNLGSQEFGPLSMDERNAISRRLNLEMSQLVANGALGNLVLPQELYEFVKGKVETGEFASPTEVLTAAMPFLRDHRGQSPRGEFIIEHRYVLFG